MNRKTIVTNFMTYMAVAFAAVVGYASFAASPVEWRNLDKENHLAGRMASSGYLRGKVVLVDCRDYGDKRGKESMLGMESAWQTFKMKQFVLVGSHRGKADAKKIRRIAKGLPLTYPIYRDADIVKSGDGAYDGQTGFVYVVSPTGVILYKGSDEHRAMGLVASALMAMRSPQTPSQWKHYLDFDIDVLPGRALLGIEEFRKAFPLEAKEYDAEWSRLSGDKDICRVAKLEKLTLQAKDYDFGDSRAKRLSDEKVRLAIEIFSDLKESGNPAVAQEAKNCIAELTWAAARLADK